jgi:predicted NUDIX family phosphoesterase
VAYNEDVLVFPRSVFDRLGAFNGLNLDYKPWTDALFQEGVTFFLSRDVAETDPGRKQIIPYVILECEGKVLFYVRGRRTAETRLSAKGSIGFGGHISTTDVSLFHDGDRRAWEMYRDAADREIREELHVDTSYDERLVAVLNDDSTEVGQVHFGIVHVWRLKEPNVRRREQQITQLAFLRPQDVVAQGVEIESWSALCLELSGRAPLLRHTSWRRSSSSGFAGHGGWPRRFSACGCRSSSACFRRRPDPYRQWSSA